MQKNAIYDDKWERFVPYSKDQDGRTVYEKDYDRVIFSQCFRRLAGKTQVHPFAHNDHIHTRLSHSLEVSIVGRSIVCELVNLGVIPALKKIDCCEVVKTAGIAHDMGNPPLGHIGEDAIGSWVRKHTQELKKVDIKPQIIGTYSSYDGNAQNFHIFNNLEYFENKKLSDASIAALVKYPWVCSEHVSKAGYFKIDEEEFDKRFISLGLKNGNLYSRHPLSYIMEAADDICYSMMDVDDAFEIGINGDTSTIEDFVKKLGLAENLNNINILKTIRDNRGKIIENATKEIAETFKNNIDFIMNENVAKYKINEIDPLKKDLIAMGKTNENFLGLIAALKDFSSKNVFCQRDKVIYETACYSIIETILDSWLKVYKDYKQTDFNYASLSKQSKKILTLMNISELKIGDFALTQIIDYVSGMTDRYAKFIADTLSGRLYV